MRTTSVQLLVAAIILISQPAFADGVFPPVPYPLPMKLDPDKPVWHPKPPARQDRLATPVPTKPPPGLVWPGRDPTKPLYHPHPDAMRLGVISR